jgi:hypothetical protein
LKRDSIDTGIVEFDRWTEVALLSDVNEVGSLGLSQRPMYVRSDFVSIRTREDREVPLVEVGEHLLQLCGFRW